MKLFNSKVEVYQDTGGGWRWRLRNLNGNITADGSEAYDSKSNAKRGARAAGRSLALAPVTEGNS